MTVMCQHNYCPHTAEAERRLSVSGIRQVRYVCADPGCVDWARQAFLADYPGMRIEQVDLDEGDPAPHERH